MRPGRLPRRGGEDDVEAERDEGEREAEDERATAA